MVRSRWLKTMLLSLLLPLLIGSTGWAQEIEELKRRIQELERSTQEQVQSLKRLIEQREAERAREQRARADQERTLKTLQEQLDQQRLALERQEERTEKFAAGWADFFDAQAGRKQSNNDPDPLGKDIKGNVYARDDFKIRLGGSLPSTRNSTTRRSARPSTGRCSRRRIRTGRTSGRLPTAPD